MTDYICAACLGVFRQTISEAEARAERERNYGAPWQPSDALVCEECFERLQRKKQNQERVAGLESQLQAEGDSYEWESSGYTCFMVRNPMPKTWCGYVCVPQDHPWHGLDTDDRVSPDGLERDGVETALPIIPLFIEALSGESNDDGKRRLELVVTVHGGVTWAGPRNQMKGQPDDDTSWVFGFDTGHADDFMPGLPMSFGEYRDKDYVIGETSRLAAQLRIVHRRGYR